MKKIIILILIIGSLLFSADFKLISYNSDMFDQAARQSNITDDSGNKTGLLKIYTDQTGISVEANMGVVDTDKTHPGEFWVYLSQGEKWIKISKEGFSPFEFILDPSIESDNVYVLKLKTVKTGNIMDDGFYRITFNINTAGVYIERGNTAAIQASGKSTEYKLARGEYDFKFSKTGFMDKSIHVKLKKDEDIAVNLEIGNNKTKLKLPGIVTISSDPKEAEIFLNGQKFGMTDMQQYLIAGDYNIEVRKNFYYTYEGTFTVNEEQSLDIPVIKLKPKFGYYSIGSDQVETKLYLDGAEVGTNSISKTKIESGKHTFRAELNMYHTETQEIEFKDGDEKDIKFNMKPNFGKLVIKSEPTGAIVWLNGKQVGKAPYTVEKARSGKYVVKLTKQLWSDYEDQITVKDEEISERTFPLNQNFGILTVKAEGSEIFINGKKEGNGVYQGNLKPGKYKIVAKKDKHKDAEKEIYVNIGREQEISLTPEPIMGSINIFSDPIETKGAKIILNGKMEGKTPAVIPLLIGDYKLRLTLSGYLDKSEDFTILEGENKTLRLKMQTYEGSRKEKRDFWKKQKWYSLGAFALSAGAGTYFYTAGNSYYEDYQNAPLTSTTAEVEDLRADAISADSYRDISFSVSLAPLGYFLYSWYKQSSYE